MNSSLKDNDLKFRFIKASNGIDSTRMYELENIFEYNRSDKTIKELRQRVESYERQVVKQAQRLVQAKFKEQEAARLKKEADELKNK